MERENKKRRREEEENEEEKVKKRSNPNEDVFADCFRDCTETISNFPDSSPSGKLEVFEFPRRKEKETEVLSESNQEWWKLFDLFSSDVNSYEFTGDEFCEFPAPIDFPGQGSSASPSLVEDKSGPSQLEEKIDGVDCIWSCALDQPLCWIDEQEKRFQQG